MGGRSRAVHAGPRGASSGPSSPGSWARPGGTVLLGLTCLQGSLWLFQVCPQLPWAGFQTRPLTPWRPEPPAVLSDLVALPATSCGLLGGSGPGSCPACESAGCWRPEPALALCVHSTAPRTCLSLGLARPSWGHTGGGVWPPALLVPRGSRAGGWGAGQLT